MSISNKAGLKIISPKRKQGSRKWDREINDSKRVCKVSVIRKKGKLYKLRKQDGYYKHCEKYRGRISHKHRQTYVENAIHAQSIYP